MQTIRHIYEHAPESIPLPAEFINSMVEVLIIQLEKKESSFSAQPEPVTAYLSRLQTFEPVKLSALALDTTNLNFDREELNAR